MSDWSRLEETMKRMEPIRKVFGPIKHRAVPILNDCVNYELAELRELVNLSREIEAMEYGPKVHEKVAQFAQILECVKRSENPKERIYLWPEGNMPAETDYCDNSQYRYNHDPDFLPYFFELLLPEDVTPKGAVILCAGGDHGTTVLPEAYQSALDFGKMGYQCFILLNRTNHNPWTAREAGVDAARAVRMVRSRAQAYRIRPDQIAFAGFSNGGLTGEGLIEYFSGKQTVKSVFPEYQPDELDGVNATPDAFLCIYGPRFAGDSFDYDQVVYPPTFFAVGREDGAMDNLNAVYPDLIAHGVSVEVHTFAGTPHGQAGAKILGGKEYPNFELWLPLADAFLMNLF